MKAEETEIKGCYLITLEVFRDERGAFVESYNKKRFDSCLGKGIDFVQDNQSISKRGVLRGLHFQKGKSAQSKLIQVTRGKVLDVVVDLRKNEGSYGKHLSIELSANDNKLLFIPKGLAHGFLVLSEEVIFQYKCDEYYNSTAEAGIIYNDPDLGINWGGKEEDFIVSAKDKVLPNLKDLAL